MSPSSAPSDETVHDAPSARQQAVLDAVLALLVEEGDQLTMDAVARRASCSKETLYKWFGDRDGLLTATVRWQASRVHAGRDAKSALDAATLRDRLLDFAVTWLDVIAGRTSVVLNRIAIAHGIVLANGRLAIGGRVKPVLEAGRTAGFLAFEDSETAFRTFLGLVGRDIQIRLLLGDALDLDAAEIRRDAARAVDQFLALYGQARP
jgi:AcrR family transcriptional regulator